MEMYYRLSKSSCDYLKSLNLVSNFGFPDMTFSHSSLPVKEIILFGYLFRQLDYHLPVKKQRKGKRKKGFTQALASLIKALRSEEEKEQEELSKTEKSMHDAYVDKVRESMAFLREMAYEGSLPSIISWVGHSHRTWTAVDVDDAYLADVDHFNYREGSFRLDEHGIKGKNLIINPGPVGLPFAKKGIAHYAIYRGKKKMVEMCQVPYAA